MPEMPEVETIRRSLTDNVVNKKIESVSVFLDRLIKHPDAEQFVETITGKTIIALNRTGKYLRFVLSDDTELVVHLRMTGQLLYSDSELDVKYARLIMFFTDGSKLVYADLRTLGALYAIKKDELGLIKGLDSMGPEPLSAEFTAEYLKKTLNKKRVKMKSFLLNQSYIGGLGNIYADEALFLAGIHPERLANSVKEEEVKKLYDAINKVIQDGINDGGTTFSDYRDGNGEKGSHQDNLFVYQREDEPCKTCGAKIERVVVGGRSSHFCPKCQSLGKGKKK